MSRVLSRLPVGGCSNRKGASRRNRTIAWNETPVHKREILR